MKLEGRIIKIKKTKHNIFIIIKNYNIIQIVVKENLFHKCNNLVIGDIISCIVEPDNNNNGKYKCTHKTYKLINLKIISKNNMNKYLKYDYEKLKKYSDAKLKIRNYLNDNKYIEVTIPVLTDGEISSKATSYQTNYSKTGKKLFLRKTLDIFLRMLSCNDINKIYSIGPCFRNEYVTSKNVSEFEMLSIFTNYMNQREAISLSIKILKIILENEKIIIKKISDKDYKNNYENDVFYIISGYKNIDNSYADINEDGTTNEFKIKYNNVTLIHGVMEISNYKEYIHKVEKQGKKENYGELKNLEDMINSGAPICYNLGISIIRILSVYYKNKLNEYDIFSFSRLNLKKE